MSLASQNLLYPPVSCEVGRGRSVITLRQLEVDRIVDELLEKTFRPFVGRLDDERLALATNADFVRVEPELLRQTDRLAPTAPEHLGDHGLLGHPLRYTMGS